MVLDPFHCRNRTWVLFLQCMRLTGQGAQSTGDTESGSLEPDEIYVYTFSVTTAGRPAKDLVGQAHREDVDRPRLGRLGSLCIGSTAGRPGQLCRPFLGVLSTIFLVTLG